MDAIAAAGDAITLGWTRNREAFAVCLLDGVEYPKEYGSTQAELDDVFLGLYETYIKYADPSGQYEKPPKAAPPPANA